MVHNFNSFGIFWNSKWHNFKNWNKILDDKVRKSGNEKCKFEMERNNERKFREPLPVEHNPDSSFMKQGSFLFNPKKRS